MAILMVALINQMQNIIPIAFNNLVPHDSIGFAILIWTNHSKIWIHMDLMLICLQLAVMINSPKSPTARLLPTANRDIIVH